MFIGIVFGWPHEAGQCSLGSMAGRCDVGRFLLKRNIYIYFFNREVRNKLVKLFFLDFLKRSVASMANIYVKTENN